MHNYKKLLIAILFMTVHPNSIYTANFTKPYSKSLQYVVGGAAIGAGSFAIGKWFNIPGFSTLTQAANYVLGSALVGLTLESYQNNKKWQQYYARQKIWQAERELELPTPRIDHSECQKQLKQAREDAQDAKENNKLYLEGHNNLKAEHLNLERDLGIVLDFLAYRKPFSRDINAKFRGLQLGSKKGKEVFDDYLKKTAAEL